MLLESLAVVRTLERPMPERENAQPLLGHVLLLG
jgi:hypothetical protein